MSCNNVKTCKCLTIGTKMHGWMKQNGSMDSTNINTLIYTEIRIQDLYREKLEQDLSRLRENRVFMDFVLQHLFCLADSGFTGLIIWKKYFS